MKCIIAHEVQTETGFKVFEAGLDYPPEEIGDRGKYFETEKPPKRAAKITEEVSSHDAG